MIDTVELSLFGGDQCSWISWAQVTLTHKFTSPQNILKKAYESSCIEAQQISYLRNKFQMNKQNFDTPQTLAPMNENDFRV